MADVPRRVLLLVLSATLGSALSGCSTVSAAAPRTIEVAASDVMPFQPSNSVWYSYSDLHARQPFARWEQQRDRIQLVTWPTTCTDVPTAISVSTDVSSVRVRTGQAPRATGPRQCSPGHVLTSTFAGPRSLRRDRPTTLLLAGQKVLLPAAPAMRTEPVTLEIQRAGTPHPLRQIDRALPQYSVRDYPWNLTRPVDTASTAVPIGWIGGTCQTNASIAYVVETATTVTIDTALAPPPLHPRSPRHSSAAWCAGVGTSLSATIHLTHPLGTRTLLQHQYVHRPANQNAY